MHECLHKHELLYANANAGMLDEEDVLGLRDDAAANADNDSHWHSHEDTDYGANGYNALANGYNGSSYEVGHLKYLLRLHRQEPSHCQL